MDFYHYFASDKVTLSELLQKDTCLVPLPVKVPTFQEKDLLNMYGSKYLNTVWMDSNLYYQKYTDKSQCFYPLPSNAVSIRFNGEVIREVEPQIPAEAFQTGRAMRYTVCFRNTFSINTRIQLESDEVLKHSVPFWILRPSRWDSDKLVVDIKCKGKLWSRSRYIATVLHVKYPHIRESVAVAIAQALKVNEIEQNKREGLIEALDQSKEWTLRSDPSGGWYFWLTRDTAKPAELVQGVCLKERPVLMLPINVRAMHKLRSGLIRTKYLASFALEDLLWKKVDLSSYGTPQEVEMFYEKLLVNAQRHQGTLCHDIATDRLVHYVQVCRSTCQFRNIDTM